MDAVEHLAGLDDAPCRAGREIDQHVAAGPVNAGEPEDRDGASRAGAEVAPGVLGSEPGLAARRNGAQRTRLVDPCAVMVAIDADG